MKTTSMQSFEPVGAGAKNPKLTADEVIVWIAQATLVAVFGIAGFMKLALPGAPLSTAMGLPLVLVRFIGFAEVAGAVALDPLLARLSPRFNALAAAGLTIVMALAAAYHAGRGEFAVIPLNVALGAIAAFVAHRRTYRLHGRRV